MQVHYGEGVANHADPESCAAYREVCGEALTGERAGQPLSRESFLIPDADAVQAAEGDAGGRVTASALLVRRGLRPWHVRKLSVFREPGDLVSGRAARRRAGPCREGEEP